MESWEALVGTRDDPEARRAIAAAVSELYETGRGGWQDLPVLSPEDFASQVAVTVPPDVEPVTYLRGLVAADLYLACACARGLPGAVEAFDAGWLSRVPDYVRHIDRSPGFGEEIQQ